MQRPSRKSIIPKMIARVSPLPTGSFERILTLDKGKRILLEFLVADFNRIVQVSGHWYIMFHAILKEMLEELDNRFIKAYVNLLSFRNSDFQITPFKVDKRKFFRWDRNLIAEVLPGHEGQSISIGYRRAQLKQEYRFDIHAKGKSRTVWILRQDTQHDYDSVSQTPFVSQVCVGDCIKIAINFNNKMAFTSPDKIFFEEPVIQQLQQRICPIENVFFDWVFFEFVEKCPNIKDFYLGEQLRMVDYRIAGGDTKALRFVYEGNVPGMVRKERAVLGIPVEIVDHNVPITQEVKKYGLVAEMQNKIQLRKDDTLIFYKTLGD